MDLSDTVIWTVNGGPASLPGDYPYISPSIVAHTDGAGKITGTGWFWLDYASGPYTAFLVDITGRISSGKSKNNPIVTMQLKGSGYNLDGNGGATLNKITARFAGSPGADPNAPGGLQAIIGKLTMKITGTTQLGTNHANVVIDAMIPGSTADAPFVSESVPLSLSAKVLQSSKRMLLYGYDFEGKYATNADYDLTGTGSVSKNNYRFSVKGVGDQKGWSLNVNGALGIYESQERPGTNFLAPASATVKGKIQGQTVSEQTTNISAELITGTVDDFVHQ